MTDDRIDMARALELAALGLNTTDPNPRVGCVLVRDGRVVGEGWHVRAGEPHAEVHALRVAGGQAQGATAYVTLEPCSHTGRTPPCADALIAAGVTRVVCASVDPNPKVAGGGIRRLESAGIAVTVGVLGTDARALNIGFFSRFERGRPFVRLKMAMSLDARTAPAAGGKAWISDEASRADVQVWRARSSAILTGAGTVRVDDPRLDVRLAYGPWVRQPVRIVLDPDLTCAPNSKMFNEGNALIFAAVDAPDRHDAAVRIERVRRAARGLDLDAVVERLAALEINELFVECGPRLAAAFLEADLVDELILYVAPHFLGADAAPLAALCGSSIPKSLLQFEFRDQRLIQNDLRLVLTPRRA
ncbi:MAG: bifunctional diaminohydroxyphosphoribosylaminopyrimidine deaminase/5-amino-6-(5-phosphoribosylamino)uracil reductase RibD [Steroidobacteraceae bacterium]|jgi:diaminohydroxyphosphoribosylaminopyrimidine deaminase/5-amino-6-(5-phosphoribosylamino)uracil reductase